MRNLNIFFIDDGSVDKTIELLKEYSQKDNRVRFVSFSRNFGKEAAMYAGLKESTGDYVAIMDVDLQDPPELIPEMYETLLKNNMIVLLQKEKQEKEKTL